MIRNVSALTQRELYASFFSPIAYVVAAVFLVAAGYLFMTQTFIPGAEATIRPMLGSMALLLVFAMPLLTMRVLSDEFASGTIETLMTAPVTDIEVILAKFLGVLIFYVALLATTLVHVAVLWSAGGIEAGVVCYGYVGMLLLGSLYIAVGVFASALTRHQLVAAILAIGMLSSVTWFIESIAKWKGGAWRSALSYVNVLHHFDDFAKGMFDTRAIVFFISGTAFFLFLAVKVMEARRWR